MCQMIRTLQGRALPQSDASKDLTIWNIAPESQGLGWNDRVYRLIGNLSFKVRRVFLSCKKLSLNSFSLDKHNFLCHDVYRIARKCIISSFNVEWISVESMSEPMRTTYCTIFTVPFFGLLYHISNALFAIFWKGYVILFYGMGLWIRKTSYKK